jgi:hypothetical protein
VWGLVAVFLALLALLYMGVYTMARDEQVFEESYEFNTNAKGEASFVTDPFELKGRTSDVELTTRAQVENGWI